MSVSRPRPRLARRFNGVRYFLTYPQCDVDPATVMGRVRERFEHLEW